MYREVLDEIGIYTDPIIEQCKKEKELEFVYKIINKTLKDNFDYIRLCKERDKIEEIIEERFPILETNEKNKLGKFVKVRGYYTIDPSGKRRWVNAHLKQVKVPSRLV